MKIARSFLVLAPFAVTVAVAACAPDPCAGTFQQKWRFVN